MTDTKIGKYKIIRLIGEGGMSAVYEAEHEMLGTKVAIKVLHPVLSSNAQIKERFRNEARVMAALNHPGITKVIDFDEQPQQLSIVMEYLEGEDLNQKIKTNGPLTEKQFVEIFSQTLSAFQYAHEKGIVHRDIKPSNIFILPNGHVKILDFGIAKLYGQGNELTQTGTQMGTPVYMSPEQVRADKSIDHRSDIYSLGVTMYYAISGKPPYDSNTTSQFDIFNKIVYEPLPELQQTNRFGEIIKKACQKNRDERFEDCIDFNSILTNASNSNTINEEYTIIEKLKNDTKKNLNENNYNLSFIKDSFSFKMGKYKEYELKLTNGKTYKINLKVSDNKYFIYLDNHIYLFPDIITCYQYLIDIVDLENTIKSKRNILKEHNSVLFMLIFGILIQQFLTHSEFGTERLHDLIKIHGDINDIPLDQALIFDFHLNWIPFIALPASVMLGVKWRIY